VLSRQPEDTPYHILNWSCAASQQAYPADVCCGSKEDINRSNRDVGFVPKAEVGPASFDDLIGACEQRRWHIDAERLRGLQIDDELELGQCGSATLLTASHVLNSSYRD
jgi:hypothetical protein